MGCSRRIACKLKTYSRCYSLTPGRYVGYSIKIDEDFDYRGRMKEIHSELSDLNNEANELMDQILSVKP